MNPSRTVAVFAAAVLALATCGSALAQRPGPPRDPHMNRPAPGRRPPPPPPRPYYHNYNGNYYAAPVYAPPPVVYTPQPSVGLNLVIPFHF
jgi:hypothetical protein